MSESEGNFVPPQWMAAMADQFNSTFRSLLMGPDTRTPEQKERDRAEFEAETERIRVTVMAKHAEHLARATGLQRQVLELHAPVFDQYDRRGRCDGCDFGGCEAEAPEFPCRTYELAAAAQ
jgi:hypothetical protein